MGRPLIAHGWSDVVPPDLDMVRRAWAVLAGDGLPREVRALPFGKSATCRTAAEVIAAVKEWSDARGLYVTLNPVRPELAKAATNGDITGRWWILVDIDPVRPADVSSTDTEKGQAARLADLVIRGLAGRGWPMPVILDSGNGFHLLYRVDLPNDPLAAQWVRSVLIALDVEFSDVTARIDKSVHNAARISKLPGTWTRKGPDSPERPHRMARILHAPEPVGVVGLELMRDLIGHRDTEPPKAKAKLRLRATSGPGPDAYCLAALAGECAAVALASDGDRNNTLNRAAFALGTLLHLKVFDRPEVEARLQHAARRAGLADREIDRTIASGLDAGILEPRDVPERGAENGRAKVEDMVPGGRRIIWASEIVPRRVEFLWPGRIPIGKMTTFAGPGGLGKTFALCDIAARVSTGAEWPFCCGECAESGKVLFISGEDDEDDTLVPRLIECGADRGKIAFLSPESHDHFTLAALELLSEAIRDMDGDVRFVAIDPPTSYLGGVDDHRNAELRGLLTPLKRWAAANRVAIVLNNHTNKNIGANVDAAARVMGSVAWVNAVRAAHMFVKDPDDPTRVLFVPIKMNIARMPPGIAYRIIQVDGDRDRPRLEWLEEVDTTADEAIQGVKRQTRGRSAVEFLEELFREKREWPSDDLMQAAIENGLTPDVLWRSPEVKLLPIRKRPIVTAHGKRFWVWQATDPEWPRVPELDDNEMQVE